MSTNKVYGDAPNDRPMIELETRYEFARPEDYLGIDENCRVNLCLHTLFGASKTSADIMAQEYGLSFGMNVGIFCGGCLTGPSHTGVHLQGFLSYLIKAALKKLPYTIYGYKGKQLRDQIHSYDVVRAFEEFIDNPRPGQVYNIGGGRSNSASVIETIALVEEISDMKLEYIYEDQPRKGDQICNVANLQYLRQLLGWACVGA